MKKIILTVVALILISGLATAAYSLFSRPAQASTVESSDAPKEAKVDGDEKKKSEDDAKVAFVKMDPLTLPVVSDHGVVQIINISITLEATDAEAAKDIERFAPRLKDAYIQSMYGMLGKKGPAGVINADGVIEVNHVKERLHMITTKVLGEEKVRDVLLQSVQQRPV